MAIAAAKRANWWIVGALVFCLTAWALGVIFLAKTAHIYAHRSPAGFSHDLINHARGRWVQLKQAVAPTPDPPKTAKPS